MSSFTLISAALRRKKTRTFLTFLSVVFAFLIFGVLSMLQTAFSMGADIANEDRLVVRHRVSLFQLLPQSYEADMEEIPGVVDAMHMTWFGGVYQDPSNWMSMQSPVVPAEYLDMYPEILLTEEEKTRWIETRNGAIAGRAVAERLGWKVGDRIPLRPTIWRQEGQGDAAWEFELVGIYESDVEGSDENQFLFRYDFFDEARSFGRGQIGWFAVRIADPDRAPEIAAAIDDTFRNSAAETKSESEGAFAAGFANQLGNLGLIVTSILAAVFFTILLVAGNTMAQSVRERIGEIGLLKALGFTATRVQRLVLMESVTLVTSAGFLGMLLAVALQRVLRSTLAAFFPGLYLRPEDLLLGLGLAVATGLVVGVFPAWRAMRLETALALRRL
ncbi:MAG: FtsX-like permease family protein [Acidobacteriota bacterium]|nr:FtsX-like permease family protein [Acidobacteriota bacterium]